MFAGAVNVDVTATTGAQILTCVFNTTSSELYRNNSLIDSGDAGAQRVEVADAGVGLAGHAFELWQLVFAADDGERLLWVVVRGELPFVAGVRVVAEVLG